MPRERAQRVPLYLTHPEWFTSQQAKAIELMANGLREKEVAEKLGVTPGTLSRIIAGDSDSAESEPSTLGIRDVIKQHLGFKPAHMKGALAFLVTYGVLSTDRPDERSAVRLKIE